MTVLFRAVRGGSPSPPAGAPADVWARIGPQLTRTTAVYPASSISGSLARARHKLVGLVSGLTACPGRAHDDPREPRSRRAWRPDRPLSAQRPAHTPLRPRARDPVRVLLRTLLELALSITQPSPPDPNLLTLSPPIRAPLTRRPTPAAGMAESASAFVKSTRSSTPTRVIPSSRGCRVVTCAHTGVSG
jgi:hypothetical protein